MRIRLTVQWDEFSIGLSITWRERIAFGLGPILLGIYWGPAVYRCEECQRLETRAALAGIVPTQSRALDEVSCREEKKA